jgi:putative salt-induced outer membrane protein YdiY
VSILRCACVVLAISRLATHPALADKLVMENGDRLSGEILGMSGDVLRFNSPYAGEITVGWTEIASVQSDKPVTLLLDDDTVLSGTLGATQEGGIVVRPQGEDRIAQIEFADVSDINPPPEVLGTGATVSGRFDIGASLKRGNSESSTVYMDTDTRVLTHVRRFKLHTELHYEGEDQGTTTQNAHVAAGWDRFRKHSRWYELVNSSFDYDKFTDLNLRSAVGPGLGYRFWKAEQRNLDLEGGLNLVHENWSDKGNQTYIAARWGVDMDHYVFRRAVQFFHRNSGLVGLQRFEDISVRTRTGLRFPLIDRLHATTQVNVDWNSDPPAETKKTDFTYLLTGGYTW